MPPIPDPSKTVNIKPRPTMFVLHPYDETTLFLQVLYGDMEGIVLHTGEESRKSLGSLLYHLPPSERVMLLGHGGPEGLYRREGEGYRCYVGRSMGYILRRHPVIGIWCHADIFARRNGLHGLFTGMVVSEMDEAREYGIRTTEAELKSENGRFAATLRNLLDSPVTPGRIPELMREVIGDGPAVRTFNYNSIFCL